MPGSEWADLEWREQIARRIEAERRRPLRIRDLVGAVAVSAAAFGLIRFAAVVLEGPGVSPIFAWLASVAVAGGLAGLGIAVAVGMGRVSTLLYGWGRGRSGMLASAAVKASMVADFAGLALLMMVALGFTLFLVVSLMMLWMSLV